MEQQAIKKIIRSRKERVFAGICGGLAVYLGLDPVLVRVLFVALTMLSNGVGVIVYLLGWFIIPLEPEGAPAYIPPTEPSGSNRTLKIVGIFLLVAGLVAIVASFLPSAFDLAEARWLGPIILMLIGIVFILWQRNANSAESDRAQPETSNAQTGGNTMSAASSQSTQNVRRLMRSKTYRKIAGICGGFGEYFNVDPTIIRLIWLALLLVGGTGLLLYIICWIAMPLDERTPTMAATPPPPAATPAPTAAPPAPEPADTPTT
jgi:phage shock protein C